MQNGGQLLLLAVLVVFTVWVFSRGRRQQRETQATQSRVHAGAEIMTTSGLYGTVVEVNDDGSLSIETSPGVVSRWDRRAVARILPSSGPEPADEAALDEPAAPAEPVVPVEPGPPAQDTAPPDRA